MNQIYIFLEDEKIHWIDLEEFTLTMLDPDIISQENRRILRRSVQRGGTFIFTDFEPIQEIIPLNLRQDSSLDNPVELKTSTMDNKSKDPILFLSPQGQRTLQLNLEEEAAERKRAQKFQQQLLQEEVMRRIIDDDERRRIGWGLRSLEADLTQANIQLKDLADSKKVNWPRKKKWRRNQQIYAKEREANSLTRRMRNQLQDLPPGYVEHL